MVIAMRWLCGIRYRVIGQQNLPAEPFVILSRHESTWETMAYQLIMPPVAFVLRQNLLNIPFWGWGLRYMSPIAINRESGREALRKIRKQGRQRLQEGFVVVVFPEGTRMAPNDAVIIIPAALGSPNRRACRLCRCLSIVVVVGLKVLFLSVPD